MLIGRRSEVKRNSHKGLSPLYRKDFLSLGKFEGFLCLYSFSLSCGPARLHSFKEQVSVSGPSAAACRSAPSRSESPGPSAPASCPQSQGSRDWQRGSIQGLRKGGRGGGTRGPGGGVRLGHCARAGAGRWSLARGLPSQLRIASTALAANRPQVVGVDSVRCAEGLTESRTVFTIRS